MKSDMSVISSYNYVLDAIGNHLQVEQNEPLNPIVPSKDIRLIYDKENRLTNAGGVTFTYDSNGNMTGKGSDTFAYDFENRLIQSNIAAINSQYGYDGVGNRLVRTEGGVARRYVLDVNTRLPNVLAETDSTGTITAYYVYGLGLISKVSPNGTTLSYHYDSRGSTIALTDESQTTSDAYVYDSFGRVSNNAASTLNPFRYVGRYGVMDEGNGLNHIRVRYYMPELGRFISKDPKAGNTRDGQSQNKYLYALNNPVRFVDLSGLSAQEGSYIFSKFGSSDEYHYFLIEPSSTANAGSTPAVLGIIFNKMYSYNPTRTQAPIQGGTYLSQASTLTPEEEYRQRMIQRGIERYRSDLKRAIVSLPGNIPLVGMVYSMIAEQNDYERKLDPFADRQIDKLLREESGRDYLQKLGEGRLPASLPCVILEFSFNVEDLMRQWGVDLGIIDLFERAE